MIRYLKEGWILIDTATETMWGTTVYSSREEMYKYYKLFKSKGIFSVTETVKPLRKKQRLTVEDIKK